MFFSIIVSVYNTEAYLDKCLQSILHQTFTDFEVILINDGSKDNMNIPARRSRLSGHKETA